jgi:hypothetical protein
VQYIAVLALKHIYVHPFVVVVVHSFSLSSLNFKGINKEAGHEDNNERWNVKLERMTTA